MLVSTAQWSEPTVSTHILPLFWISVPFRPLWSTEKSFLCWAVCSHYLAISWKVKGKSLSRVRLFATPWTGAYQAPPSMGFSRQEYWSGLPLPSPGDLPNPGIKPRFSALQADTLPYKPPGKPLPIPYIVSIMYICQSQSSNSSHLPLSPIPLFSMSVSPSALQIRLSIPIFFKFHIYVLIYSICFSPDLLHSVWKTLSPSTSLQMTQFHSFLWLSNIPLHICTTSPSILLLMYI